MDFSLILCGEKNFYRTVIKKTENIRQNDELSPACAPFVLPEGLRIVTFSLIR